MCGQKTVHRRLLGAARLIFQKESLFYMVAQKTVHRSAALSVVRFFLHGIFTCVRKKTVHRSVLAGKRAIFQKESAKV